jgi:acetyl esterase/lipase
VDTDAIAARLDPGIAALLDQWSLPVATTRDEIPTVRQQRLMRAVELSDRVERTDHQVPGPPDGPPVRVRVHRPLEVASQPELREPLPCVVSIHGGGYIVGSYVDDDLRHDRWCPRLGYVGVAVDYRLAPETPYPGPLEDCYAALVWVHANAGPLGVDPARIGIGGFSAGGGLAAGLALLARDRGELPVAFQQLVYPMVDDRRATPTSSWAVPVWGPGSNTLGWSCYLGDRFGTDDVPPYAAAARATDLEGLPPTFVGVGTLDLFCDEDVAFAQRLNHAGVPVELHVYPGAPHAFDMLSGQVDVATRAVRDQREWLAAQLAVR